MSSTLRRSLSRLPAAVIILSTLSSMAAHADTRSSVRQPVPEPVKAAPVQALPVQAVPNAPASQSRLQTIQFDDTGSRLISVSGDFNNDGYPDLVVGNPTYANGESQEGSLEIFYGTANGFATVPGFHYETNVVSGFIGSSPIVADVNGDGYPDLIVGGYNYGRPGEAKAGAVFVFFGSANGLATQPSQIITPPSPVASTFFGNNIRKLGDFNRDGYADIVVSAQGLPAISGTGGGVVYVLVGSATGLVPTPYSVIRAPTGEYNFGAAIDTGDSNGDGFIDIMVSKSSGSAAGRVRVYRGSATGPATTPSETIVGGNPGDYFGDGLAFLGDVNGDGFGDLAIGAPSTPIDGVSTGNITIYFGSAGGYGASTLTPQILDGTSASGGYRGFGGWIFGGRDFNGDGYADLIIGTDYNSLPLVGDTSFPGHLWVLRGGPTGIQLSKPLVQLDGAPGSLDSFGYGSIAIADVNRDGRTDLITCLPTTVVLGTPSPIQLRIYYGLDKR